jgi:hypothetical protein
MFVLGLVAFIAARRHGSADDPRVPIRTRRLLPSPWHRSLNALANELATSPIQPALVVRIARRWVVSPRARSLGLVPHPYATFRRGVRRAERSFCEFAWLHPNVKGSKTHAPARRRQGPDHAHAGRKHNEPAGTRQCQVFIATAPQVGDDYQRIVLARLAWAAGYRTTCSRWKRCGRGRDCHRRVSYAYRPSLRSRRGYVPVLGDRRAEARSVSR